MGTALTGLEIKDTYDSLIKVTDNGPISGTLKALSDGLGNDSTLSLSTTAASIAGTLAVSGNATFDTNTLFVDAASNEVGIGTASPQSIFHIGAAAPANAGAKAYTGLAATAEGFLFDYYYDTTASNLRLFDVVSLGAATTGIGGSALRFLTVPQTTTNTPLERMRITAAGNVGIGTTAPATTLDVSGTLAVSGQVTLATASGNVGIGITPQSWLSSRKALEINNGGALAGVNAGWMETWGNSYLDAAGTTKYLQTGGAALYALGNVADGGHIFYTAATGTAGATVTLTEKMRINAAGNVGIGTSAPNFILEAAGTTGIGVRSTGVDGVYTDILSSIYSGNANEQNAIQASVSGVASNSGFRFQVSDGSGLSTQTVGYQLNKDRHIFYANGTERVRVTTDGLTFNGDTAAANALDDYEEGTWTMGVSFGGASVGVTYNLNGGTYTKIGRQVNVNGYVALTNKGSSTGNARITGLPFAIANANSHYAAVTLFFNNVSFTNQFEGYGLINTTTMDLLQITALGLLSPLTDANFANNSEVIVNFTYYV